MRMIRTFAADRLKGAVSGTALLLGALVAGLERFYRFTPSQIAAPYARPPLPPTAMRRVYLIASTSSTLSYMSSDGAV